MLAEPSSVRLVGVGQNWQELVFSCFGEYLLAHGARNFPERKDMVVKAGSQLPKLKEQKSLGITVFQ